AHRDARQEDQRAATSVGCERKARGLALQYERRSVGSEQRLGTGDAQTPRLEAGGLVPQQRDVRAFRQSRQRKPEIALPDHPPGFVLPRAIEVRREPRRDGGPVDRRGKKLVPRYRSKIGEMLREIAIAAGDEVPAIDRLRQEAAKDARFVRRRCCKSRAVGRL